MFPINVKTSGQGGKEGIWPSSVRAVGANYSWIKCVRPHMGVQFWSNSIARMWKIHMHFLQRMHKRFTTLMPGLEGTSYNEILDKPGLLLLHHRRLT